MGKKKTTEKKPVEEEPKENLEDEILADLAELDEDMSGAGSKSVATEPEVVKEETAAVEEAESAAEGEEEAEADDDFAEGLDDLPDDETDNFDAVEAPAAAESEVKAEPAPSEVAPAEVPGEPAAPQKSEEELLKEATAEVEEEIEEEEEEEAPQPKKGTGLSPEQERLRKRSVIEAALFVAGKPLSIEDLIVKPFRRGGTTGCLS